ncbi:MFS transporter [Sphingobium chungangianum]
MPATALDAMSASAPAIPAASGGGLPLPRRYVAIFAISCGAGAVVLDATAPVVGLPTIAAALDVDNAATTLIVAVYQLVLVATLLPFAALAERVGCRKLYCTGQLLFALASLLCLFVHSLPAILALRCLQGLGAAATLSSAGALMRAIYPAGQLGRGMGLQSTIVSLAMAVAPTLGGFVLKFASWPWLFACAAPLSVVTLACARALPALEGHDEPFDWLAAATNALLFTLLMGSLQLMAHGELPFLASAMAALGLVVGFFFVRNQLRARRPVLPVDLLREPRLAFACLTALLTFTGTMVMLLTLPFRLADELSLDPATIGMVMMAYPTMTMLLAPVSGILSDKVRPKILVTLGLLTSASALLSLGFLSDDRATAWTFGLHLLWLGVGFGFAMTANARSIIDAVPPERTASGGSMISFTRMTGQSLGAASAAILLAGKANHSGLPALLAGFLLLGAALMSLSRGGKAKA